MGCAVKSPAHCLSTEPSTNLLLAAAVCRMLAERDLCVAATLLTRSAVLAHCHPESLACCNGTLRIFSWTITWQSRAPILSAGHKQHTVYLVFSLRSSNNTTSKMCFIHLYMFCGTRIILLPLVHKVILKKKKKSPKPASSLWSCWKHIAAPFKSQALSEKYQQNAVGCSYVSQIQQVLEHGDSHKVHSIWRTSQRKFCLLVSGGWRKGGAFKDKSEKMGDMFFPVPLHKMCWYRYPWLLLFSTQDTSLQLPF